MNNEIENALHEYYQARAKHKLMTSNLAILATKVGLPQSAVSDTSCADFLRGYLLAKDMKYIRPSEK